MKSSRIGLICIIVITLVIGSTGCVNKLFARNELIEAEKSYKNRQLPEAEKHARNALAYDSASDTAQVFISRIVLAQFKPGVETPENKAKGEQAITEYKKLLQVFEPQLKTTANDKKAHDRAQRYADEGFRQVTHLLEAMKKDDELQAWLKERAENESANPSQRSEAYTFLASQQHKCSNDINEQNKQTTKDNKFVYVKPKVAEEFEKAAKCAETGLNYAQKALDLNANNDIAWSYKGNLLLEESHQAEMSGDKAKMEQTKQQAEEALKKYTELNAEKQKKKEAEEEAKRKAEEEANQAAK
jgi:hypothetical protein